MRDYHELLGKSLACESCGRTHRVPVEQVILSPDALGQLTQICGRHAGHGEILLLADARTFEVAGRLVQAELQSAGLDVAAHVVPDPPAGRSPVCDDSTKERMASRLPHADLILAVGSGVINDLAKWIAADRTIPYVAVPTAASMNGYSAENVAATIRGVKRLVPARVPVAIVADSRILAGAPHEMTAAGLGDVLAKSVSSVDWRMNQILFGDYYCQRCVDLQNDIEPQCISQSARIGQGSPEAIGVLFDALVLTGLIMTMVGSSIPASGAEHAISHTLDMMSSVDGRPHDLHGRQVGLGTIVAAALYEELLSVESPTFRPSNEETDRVFWGPLAGEVEGYHGKKRERAALALGHLAGRPAKWEELRRCLGPMLQDPSSLKETLRRANAANTVGDLGMDRERFLAALLHAHEIRERYTVIDLARSMGLLPAKAGEIIDRWVVR